MTESEHPIVISAERIVAAYAVMTADEKDALHVWEAKYVTGDGTFKTTDWPGWRDVFARVEH